MHFRRPLGFLLAIARATSAQTPTPTTTAPSIISNVLFPSFSGETILGSIITENPTATVYRVACPQYSVCFNYPLYDMRVTAGPSTFAAEFGVVSIADCSDNFNETDNSSVCSEGNGMVVPGVTLNVTMSCTVINESATPCGWTETGYTYLTNGAVGPTLATNFDDDEFGLLTAGTVNIQLTSFAPTEIISLVDGTPITTLPVVSGLPEVTVTVTVTKTVSAASNVWRLRDLFGWGLVFEVALVFVAVPAILAL